MPGAVCRGGSRLSGSGASRHFFLDVLELVHDEIAFGEVEGRLPVVSSSPKQRIALLPRIREAFRRQFVSFVAAAEPQGGRLRGEV